MQFQPCPYHLLDQEFSKTVGEPLLVSVDGHVHGHFCGCFVAWSE